MFSGSILDSFCNASQLEILDVSRNNFEGKVPNCLGSSKSLCWLTVGINNLGYNSTSELAFLTSLKNCSNLNNLDFNFNHLGGFLPYSIANLSVQLNKLYVGGNQIAGSVPEALGNFINLISDMITNLFTGFILSFVGKLKKLQHFFVENPTRKHIIK